MTKIVTSEEHRSAFRGMAAGVAGGLTAAWVMNAYLTGSKKAREAMQTPEQRAKQKEQEASAGDDSTQRIADLVVRGVTGNSLSEQGKKTGGPLVHYIFGAMTGALYGAVTEYSKYSRLGFGTLFGSMVFIGADEVVVPALDLAPKPSEQPLGNHIDHWIAHLVYGATLEAVRRATRRLV